MTQLGFVHIYHAAGSHQDPTFLLLHGTGGNEEDLLPLARLIDSRAGVLSPRGKVLERGMPRFFRRLAEGVFDIEDLKLRTSELADFVAAAAAQYGFEPARVVAAGFSNGANIAASLLLLRPGVLRAAILFSPMVPLEPPSLPHLAGADVFLCAGRTDPIVDPANAQRLADMLREAGANVTLRWKPGGHELTREDVAAARTWYSEREVASG
jgi:phospholipase/carboxylesterase/glyoxalase family protein